MRFLVLFDSSMYQGALSHSSRPANYTREDSSENTQLPGLRIFNMVEIEVVIPGRKCVDSQDNKQSFPRIDQVDSQGLFLCVKYSFCKLKCCHANNSLLSPSQFKSCRICTPK